ncbi:MAG: TatD family hydrolase [Methanomicrobiales archaeon]|nr:TatD family hydrolase [Methanomicrobiales archaeon]
MKPPAVPITDNHIHLDPINGRGMEAAKDFQRAGGTHMVLVTKPSWSHGILPRDGSDFAAVFDATIATAEQVRSLGLGVFVVLGVHPAEITRLSGLCGMEGAVAVMQDGLSTAARYIAEGKAIGLKSGRPHYKASPEIMEASQRVLTHAISLAADHRCALQIHAESGPCSDIAELARRNRVDPLRVIKHYAIPETPLMPSLLARHPAVPDLCRRKAPFLMESDFMDEDSRPGAVSGPKSVPRTTLHLLSEHAISEEDVWRVHAETVAKVYGVEVQLPR